MPSLPASPFSVPPPVPVETHPNRAGGSKQQRALPDPNRLAPEDAYYGSPPTRSRTAPNEYDESLEPLSGNVPTPAAVAALRPPHAVPSADKDARKVRGAGRRRKRKGAWKKLLWVKQSCACLATYPSCSLGMLTGSRPGQLYRHRDLPRPSPAQPASPSLRLLAASG